MPGEFTSRNSLGLVKSPSLRQRAARRWALVVCGVLGLAIVSGAIGALSGQDDGAALGQRQTGPFSYFPSE